ncbi:dihydroorotase [Olsenella uli DSM 7084]|uniref:Dihydroorotase n=1 Tax=Olsenella uli (strain ATCC 49627 / DSM 7084 / CCUG 31166 / CIP 109912 / JCM 12494 / LMG 11480 / NCIMB 702895 / VPI D76D-27C) TaxID=633147 RepID=E1QVE9_OLSUV|nr:dihydroorotase [Olsenella uli]ADK68102.1 dihydroorotase [Olsenella uli DSM 7084]MBS6418752.1 dihydroorotase [Olsenella uli]
MAFLLKGAHAVDPQVGLDGMTDILVEGSDIVEVGAGLAPADGVEVIDATGKYLVPGLVDMHVHFRDPGFEYKETIETGSRAAVHGGFTDVATMPNTDPVTDTGTGIRYQIDRARAANLCHVRPIGALTRGQRGEALAEIGDMVMEGACAFSDDGHGVQSAGMMRTCMDYVSQFDRVAIAHCEDESLSSHGVINEGRASTRLGMFGWPALGEEMEIYRDIELCRLTGCPLHIAHISTAKGLELVKAAKAEGLPVTCEVTPHHLFLSEEDITDAFDTSLKMNPPLRLPSDAEALRRGILDGSVDCVVTDHAPHAQHEKDCEWEIAFFGTIGLETSLPLMLNNMVRTGLMSWQRLVEVMAVNPRSVLRLRPVSIEAGSRADLTLIDPDREVRVTTDYFESLSKNSAFMGETLVGAATDVFVDGRRVLEGGLVA